jgi:hypothetical protein
LKRLAWHGTKLVTRLNAGSTPCNENNSRKFKELSLQNYLVFSLLS